jgi:hypothetical protein
MSKKKVWSVEFLVTGSSHDYKTLLQALRDTKSEWQQHRKDLHIIDIDIEEVPE